MQPIQKTLKLKKDKYYEMHLAIVNNFLPVKLTDMEIVVLAKFMTFEGDIAKDRFGASARKMVKEQLGLSSAGLSNYTISLGKKGFVSEAGNILPILIPEKEEQIYQFKLINFGE